MSFELKIPSLGESITEVQISEWLKAEGDEVKKDESVAVLDSEKSTLELPAPESGRLVKILYQAGEAVKIGETVAHIETAGDSPPAKAGGNAHSAAEPAAEKPKNTPTETTPPPGEAPPQEPAATRSDSPDRERPKAAPVAQKSPPRDATNNRGATEDSSVNSPVTVEPVEENSGQPEPTGERPGQNSRTDEVVPMTMLRRTVARRLVEAKQQMAMLTTFNEVDMTAVQSLRQTYQADFEKRYQIRLGLMGFFVKAVIDALKQFPALNAEVRENNIVYHNYFDIGVAIASGRGLVVPVLRNAERLSFAEVESAITGFVGRAKEGQIKPDELEGGTFTITNGGIFGSLLSTPIINPPQTGILGMHTIQERPIALSGQVVIRPMMNLALTYDHRVVDGREAVLFLRRVKEVIEMPARMLIEI